MAALKRKAAISRAPRWQLWAAVLFAATLAAYGNHFENGFHFDDANVILDNPHIRNLGNIPRFFVDPTTYSSLPDHHIYRPVTLASLAVDYRIAQYR